MGELCPSPSLPSDTKKYQSTAQEASRYRFGNSRRCVCEHGCNTAVLNAYASGKRVGCRIGINFEPVRRARIRRAHPAWCEASKCVLSAGIHEIEVDCVSR